MLDKTNLLILIFFLALWWLYSRAPETFGTSQGTLVQLATSSTDPSWYYGYIPTFPAQYFAPYPMYSQYADSGKFPKPWSGHW